MPLKEIDGTTSARRANMAIIWKWLSVVEVAHEMMVFMTGISGDQFQELNAVPTLVSSSLKEAANGCFRVECLDEGEMYMQEAEYYERRFPLRSSDKGL